jgi:hypothetical protein
VDRAFAQVVSHTEGIDHYASQDSRFTGDLLALTVSVAGGATGK